MVIFIFPLITVALTWAVFCYNKGMKIIPDNEAYLIKAPLSIDEAHQLDFNNATAQQTYFKSLPNIPFMKITYNRENGTLYIPRNIEDVRQYNYLMYKNKNYGNKWFYAFITGMSYENNTTTGVSFVTDVFQTYMFDYEWRNSFVERETVADDTVGKHVYPEQLEYGDYVCAGVQETSPLGYARSNASSMYIVMMTTEALGTLNEGDNAEILNSIPQATYEYCFNSLTDITDFYFLRGYLDSIGKGNAILSIFIIPTALLGTNTRVLTLYDKDGNISQTTLSVKIPYNKYGVYDIAGSLEIAQPSSLDGYSPKNNKLKVAPYNYFYISNNLGSAKDFKYEDFYGTPTFKQIGVFSQGGEYALVPRNSKKSQSSSSMPALSDLKGWNEMLSGGSFPVLAWESDYYLNWCASNNSRLQAERDTFVSNAQKQIVGDVLQGVFSGQKVAGVASAVGDTVSSVLDAQDLIEAQQAERTEADRVPNSIKGNYGQGDMAFSAEKYNFSAYKMTIRYDYAKRLDDYFSKYGYRVNEHKVPNLTSRSYWNYIKTVGANLIPLNIPQEALNELKNIFNNGVTIWHDPSKFLDYSQNNSIIR